MNRMIKEISKEINRTLSIEKERIRPHVGVVKIRRTYWRNRR